MDFPEIVGYEVLGIIGRGATGTVFDAVSPDGTHWAIKVFDSMASNAALYGQQVRRVMEGGAAGVTVEVVAQVLEARPALVIMPFLVGGEESRPRTLQHRGASGLGWPFLLQLARALASLHRVKVAHGNLKPGNIFLGEDGEPLLADYACGLVPGVHHYQYSDAVLYAPPEQLRNPAGYLEEAGYGWDVFAFGVLGFRLLTGAFPRAEEIFAPVSPAFGSLERFEIEADHSGVALALEGAGPVVWPEESGDEVEIARRQVLEACLQLDPRERPANMIDVVRMLDSIEAELAIEKERQGLVAAKVRAEKQRQSTRKGLLAMSSLAFILGGGWGVTEFLRRQEAGEATGLLNREREEAAKEIADLEARVAGMVAEEKDLVAQRDRARRDLSAEQVQAAEELRSAQAVNERLFDWLLEEGVEDLPTLEGRKERLRFLLERIDEQIAGLGKRPRLADERAILKLRGAEVALAAGNLNDGERRLAEVLGEGKLPIELAARARLRSLLLQSRSDPAGLGDRLAAEEKFIQEALTGQPEALLRAGGALALAKARVWEAQQAKERALEEYLASLSCFRKLEEQFPENPILSLQVARGYLSAARAAEGEGVAGNPAKLRAQAAEAFLSLAESEDDPSPEVLYQIASARAGQAIALWQQGDVFAAEKVAREEVPALTSLQARMTGDFRVTVDLVSLQGILATALRDEGKSKEARAILEKGIAELEAGLRNSPDQGGGRYLLASLKWQLSGVLGQQAKGEAELAMGRQARDELISLLEDGISLPHPDKVRKSLAYLCGDLGHAADLLEKKNEAILFFTECRDHWSELAGRHGDDLECREGHQWAVGRLTNLGAQ
jgi:hypothetical protein